MRWLAVQTIMLAVLFLSTTLLFPQRNLHLLHWTVAFLVLFYLSY